MALAHRAAEVSALGIEAGKRETADAAAELAWAAAPAGAGATS